MMTNDLELFLKSHRPETVSCLMRWKKYEHIKNEIIGLTSFLDCGCQISERVYCIDTGITEKVNCQVCGNLAKFKTYGEGYSDTCSRKCRYKRTSVKLRETLEKRYGVTSPLQHKAFMDKAKQTTQENYGVDNIFENKSYIRQKTKEKLGVENVFEKKEFIREKFKEKYGVSSPSQVHEFIEKSKNTCMERYGVEYSFQSDNNKDKSSLTKLELYGNDTYNNRQKNINTCIERYGVSNPVYLESVKIKKEETCLERYGVRHHSQNSDIHDKQQKRRWKEYIMPSGKIVKIQGYEDKALNELLKSYAESDLVLSRKEMPEFWYMCGEKKKRYFPDIFIPKENLILEVKSTYTYAANLEINLLKETSVKDAGYTFEFMIC